MGAGDVVIELAGGGIDTIVSTRNVTTTADNIENIRLTGDAHRAVGNTGNNTPSGSTGDRDLDGGDGDDLLLGGGGNDDLTRNAGNDTLSGRQGDDAYHVSGDTVKIEGLMQLTLHAAEIGFRHDSGGFGPSRGAVHLRALSCGTLSFVGRRRVGRDHHAERWDAFFPGNGALEDCPTIAQPVHALTVAVIIPIFAVTGGGSRRGDVPDRQYGQCHAVGPGEVVITDLRSGVNDGVDTVSGVEHVSFGGGTITYAQLLGTPELVLTGVADTDTGANTMAENSSTGTGVGLDLDGRDAGGAAIPASFVLVTDASGTTVSNTAPVQIDTSTVVATVHDAARLNFEAAASQTICVRTTDADGNTITSPHLIAVSDVYKPVAISRTLTRLDDTFVALTDDHYALSD